MEIISIPNELMYRKVRALIRLDRIKHIRECRNAVERLGATHWARLSCGNRKPHKAFKNADGVWILRGDEYSQPDMKLWPHAEWRPISVEN